MFIDSWQAPWFEAPSPKNTRDIKSCLLNFDANAAPVAIGTDEATIPDSPKIPIEKSARCIEPPFPLQNPPVLPKISAIAFLTSPPFAIGCPCERWFPAMRSSSRSAAQAPTATASSPM